MRAVAKQTLGAATRRFPRVEIAGAFLVLFWHAKENLASRNRALPPRHQRANSPNETAPPQQKLYFFVSDFIKPPSAMIFWMKGGKGSA